MSQITYQLFTKALTPRWQTLDEVRERMRKLLCREMEITRFETIPIAEQALQFGFAQSETRDGVVRYQISLRGNRWKNRTRRQALKLKRRA